MLAIHDNPNIMEPYYMNGANKQKQEECLHQWMKKELGITAWFPEYLFNSDIEKESHPSKIFYKDISMDKHEDFLLCLIKLQYHKCSAFCMR